MNMRLGLDTDDSIRILRLEDILEVLRTLTGLRDGRGDLRVLTVSRLPFLPLLLLLQGQVERLHDHQVLHVQVPRRHERLVRRVVQ